MNTPMPVRSLALVELAAAYREGRTTPKQVVRLLYERIGALADRGIWISVPPIEGVLAHAEKLSASDPESLPLYGIPFAVKDNMDLAGLPTTAGCPAFAYTPAASAFVVDRLVQTGAIPIGKTNLDQFATGLSGTRSPYGPCRNSFDPQYISGGSSSGSAVAVAMGLASFSLGTDTAGSGRVPAALNNIIGLKPTCGRLSARGIVPACRTLDAVSIFALTAEDAARVCRVAEGFDAADAYSRRIPDSAPRVHFTHGPFRFGIPRSEQLQFFGNAEYAHLFEAAVLQLRRLGGESVAIDFTAFIESSRLFYEGPWLAERYLVIEALLRDAPEALHPVTREVIEAAGRTRATEAFRAQYRLQELRRRSESVWTDIDVLLTPTVGTTYRITELLADPIRLNTHLGFYTNFMNLLDLTGVAVPAGFTRGGQPFGVSLVGPAWSECDLLQLAGALQHHPCARLGSQALALPADGAFDWGA